MKFPFLFAVFLSLFIPHYSHAAGKEWVCRYKIRSYPELNPFKGCHAQKPQALRLAKLDCTRYADRYGHSESDCFAGSCKLDFCEPPQEPRDPSSPFCNYNSECGANAVCIGGICRAKDDQFNNKCTSDADCGGPFDRGHCHPFGYCE